jgi:hypothetical protein
MDLVIFILGLILLLFFIPAILTWDIDEIDQKERPTTNGRPPRCDKHMWQYNQHKRLQCIRCGKFPHGDN